jgi:hypothetical protein
MTTVSLRPIDSMNTEWRWMGRSSASRHALAALAAAEPAIEALDVGDLAELVERLRAARDEDGRNRAAGLLRAMLRSSGTHPLVPRAILQALLPGLVNVARRLAWGTGGDWEDGGAFFADAVATAWEVVVAWGGQDRPYAVLDLLSAVRCRLRRQVERHRAVVDQWTVGLADNEATVGPATAAAGTDLDLLARALDDLSGRGLDRADAAVLYGHRVLGLTLSELSRLSGRSRRQLSNGHQRAERALCQG